MQARFRENAVPGKRGSGKTRFQLIMVANVIPLAVGVTLPTAHAQYRHRTRVKVDCIAMTGGHRWVQMEQRIIRGSQRVWESWIFAKRANDFVSNSETAIHCSLNAR